MNAESVRLAAADWAGGTPDQFRLFSAPARINIIGEHCDYNDGLVLPMASAPHTWVAAQPRDDRIVRVQAAQLDDEQAFDLDNDQVPEDPRWIDYVRGVCSLLQRNDHDLVGANFYIDSDIPMGAGLSSSASLEVASGLAMVGLAGESVIGLRLAQLCRQAEHEYAQVACGLMDQFAVACGQQGYALLLDCRTESAAPVRIPEDLAFLVVDSGARRQLIDGNYNDRADACQRGVSTLQAAGFDLQALRDLSIENLESASAHLDDVTFRRVRHVVTDIDRVRSTVDALAHRDHDAVGQLLNASHVSLRDDFEISCPELDALAEIAGQHDAVFGARMMGGGFGGCVLAAVQADQADAAVADIAAQYGKASHQTPWSQIVAPVTAASEVDV